MSHTLTLDQARDVVLLPAKIKAAATELDLQITTINHATNILSLLVDNEAIACYPNGGKPSAVTDAEAIIEAQVSIIVNSWLSE